jgi:hypothetical protein
MALFAQAICSDSFFIAQSWFLVLAFVSWSYASNLAAQFPRLNGFLPPLNSNNWRKFLVTDQGKLVGAIAIDDISKVPTWRWQELQVKDLMQPIDITALHKGNIN